MNYFVNKNYVTIALNGKTSIVFENENPQDYASIIKILTSTSENKISQVTKILNKISKFHEYVELFINQTHVEVKNDDIYIGNKKLSTAFATHIKRQMDQGEQITSFVNFFNNLMKNPNKNIIDQISDFVQASLENDGFTISEDGFLYAYKKVRHNYLDIYSGTYLNIPGSKHSMDRNDVEYNRSITCSAGLHFCAWSYLDKFGEPCDNSRIIIVKINPADIVSIPEDYNNAKGRCCKYEVIGEFNYSEPIKKTVLHKKEIKSNKIVYNNISSLQEKIDAYYYAYNKKSIDDEYILFNIINVFTVKEFNELYSDFVFERTKICPELKIPKISKQKYINKILISSNICVAQYDNTRNFHNFLLKRGKKITINVLNKIQLGKSYKDLAPMLYELTLSELVVIYNACVEYNNKTINTSCLNYTTNPKCSKADFIEKLFNMCEGAKQVYRILECLKEGN